MNRFFSTPTNPVFSCFGVRHNIQIMPITRSSQISQPALSSSEEDFDISNFVDDIAENDKLLGIKPAAAGALDITARYNEGSKRIVESFLNFIRRCE